MYSLNNPICETDGHTMDPNYDTDLGSLLCLQPYLSSWIDPKADIK